MARGSCGRRRGGRGPGAIYESSIDNMVKYPAPPTLINGTYAFVGNEMSFKAQTEGGLVVAPQAMPQINLTQINMMPPTDINMQESFMGGVPPMIPGVIPMQSMIAPQSNELTIQQANITLVGTKTKPGNTCCYVLTVIFGSLLIFPLCFLCCIWWRKIVFPTYELSQDAYQAFGNFLSRAQNITNLSFSVVYNAFGSQKAKILHEAVARSRLKAFTFVNRSLNCNGQYNQADDFKTNMAGIKSLSISTNIRWGDTVV